MQQAISKIKNTIINRVIVLSAVLLTFPYILSFLRIYKSGWQNIYLYHTFIYFVLLIVTLLRTKLNLTFKIFFISFIYLFVTFIGLLYFSIGGGYYYAIMTIAILSLLVNRKYTLLLMAGIIIIFSVFAYLFVAGGIYPKVDLNLLSQMPFHWASHILSLFSLMIIFIYGFGDIYINLIQILNKKESTEKKYKLLFEEANDAITLLKDGKFFDCNQKACEMFQFTKNELIGKSVKDVSPELQYDGRPSDKKSEHLVKLTLKGQPQQFEWQHKKSNGELFDLSITLNKIELYNEVYVQGILRDITERKVKDAELVKHRHHLEKLVKEKTKDIEAALEEWKSTSEELKEKKEIIEAQNEELKSTLKNLNETQIQLLQAEQLYHGVFDNSPMGIFLFDRNGILTECNEQFIKINGAPKEKLIGLNLIEKLSNKKMVNEIKKTLQVGHGFFEDFYTSVVSGRSGFYRLLFTALKNYSDNIAGGIGILEDITEKKLAEQEKEAALQKWMNANTELNEKNEELNLTVQNLKEAQLQLIQAEKMASLGTLTAGVAHEINNPLNYIMGAYVGLEDYFKENGSKNSKKTEILLNSIKIGLDRASGIVSGLNQFSRDNDNMNENCDVHSIINNCLEMLYNKIKNKISVVKKYSQHPILTKGNVGQLHQVFTNVLTNSIQAITENGEISIKTNKYDTTINVEISDTGNGINKENITQITDPFFTTKPPGEGTGLGLSIAYKIIKKHKGNIMFFSEVHEGTKVIITLPNNI